MGGSDACNSQERHPIVTDSREQTEREETGHAQKHDMKQRQSSVNMREK